MLRPHMLLSASQTCSGDRWDALEPPHTTLWYRSLVSDPKQWFPEVKRSQTDSQSVFTTSGEFSRGPRCLPDLLRGSLGRSGASTHPVVVLISRIQLMTRFLQAEIITNMQDMQNQNGELPVGTRVRVQSKFGGNRPNSKISLCLQVLIDEVRNRYSSQPETPPRTF